MLKQLKFIDGTSEKFWQIETSGESHTVTYGKIGTDGQSKTKKFDSEETCLKDAEKLIAEKTKKGYSEDGMAEKPAKAAKTASGKKTNTAQIAEVYTTIVKEGKTQAIIPFLEEYLSGNAEFIKKEIKKAKRYWLTYTDLSKDADYKGGKSYNRWGMRGGNNQKRVIELSALATFSLSDTTSWSELITYINTPKDPAVAAILNWTKPDWLPAYAAAQFAKNDWLTIEYEALRLLESQGHFQFHPEVFARSISSYTPRQEQHCSYVTTDATAYQRDVPLVFQYETGIQNIFIHYDRNGNEDNKLHWDIIFETLLAEKKLDRDFFIQNLLEIQTKNWNVNLKSFFRKALDRLQLQEEEILRHQETFFALLHAEQSGVVNYAVDQLKPLFSNPGFQMEEFLNWLEPVFMRSDMKNGLKGLVIQFDKLSKTLPDSLTRFTHLVADLFMTPDLQLQERATKYLEKFGDPKDETLREKLAMYAPQMLGNGKSILANFLDDGDSDVDQLLSDVFSEAYEYNPVFPNKLTAENKLVLPETWNDIMFQVGSFISSKEPLDMEMVMYCWTSQQHLFPQNYKTALEPYIKQLKSGYSESALYAIFSNIFLNVHFQPDKIHTNSHNYYERIKYMHIWTKLLTHFQKLIQLKKNLPLLCMPTHRPFWVQPLTLVERIIAYEKADVDIHQLDLAVAINRMPREQTAEAIQLAEQIKDQQLKKLILFALGSGVHWREELKASKDSDVNFKGLWANAARAFYPNESFEVFEGDFKSLPFASAPFRPTIELKPYYYDGWNYQTKKNEPVFVGNRIHLGFPGFQKVPDTFLYALDLYNKGKENGSLHYYGITEKDVAFSYSIIPQNTAPLELLLTQGFLYGTDESLSGTNGLLQQLLTEHGIVRDSTVLYLAASLFTKSKTTRALAGEVLIYTINENRLPASEIGKLLGHLIAGEYGPVNRLAEVLVTLKDISHKHNDALYKMLLAIIVHADLKEKLPTNFKKLLEIFFDLSVKFNRNADDLPSEKLTKLEQFSTLKPIIGKLKKIK